VQALRRRCCSIRTREVPHSELDPTIGKLPPFLDNRHVPDLLTWLTEDFAALRRAASIGSVILAAACHASGLPNRGGKRACQTSKLYSV
jgi:hypothetical protein